MLSKEEKEELKYFANSSKLREDMQRLAETKYNPFLINGNVDADKILEFLTEYNCFINHAPKIFRKIIDKDMRL